MKFNVYDSKNKLLSTTCLYECLPDLRQLQMMEQKGCTFTVDDIAVTSKDVYTKAKYSINQPVVIVKEVKKSAPKTKKKPRHRIKCIENGVIYKTQSDAARELGLNQSLVSSAVRNHKSIKGFTFEIVEE